MEYTLEVAWRADASAKLSRVAFAFRATPLRRFFPRAR